MAEKSCIVCQRIPPKIVFCYAHKIFDGKANKQLIHKIAVEACNLINAADREKRFIFCGKSQAAILSGLFYALGLKYDLRVTQKDVAEAFPSKWGKHFCTVALRDSYRRWIKEYPELRETLAIETITQPSFDAHVKDAKVESDGTKKYICELKEKLYEVAFKPNGVTTVECLGSSDPTSLLPRNHRKVGV